MSAANFYSIEFNNYGNFLVADGFIFAKCGRDVKDKVRTFLDLIEDENHELNFILSYHGNGNIGYSITVPNIIGAREFVKGAIKDAAISLNQEWEINHANV